MIIISEDGLRTVNFEYAQIWHDSIYIYGIQNGAKTILAINVSEKEAKRIIREIALRHEKGSKVYSLEGNINR